MVGIYKVTSPTGKVYIGQSWNIENRWKGYYRGGENNRLGHSLKKHGANNHKFEVVYELPNDVEQNILDVYEQFYMDAYRDCGITLLNLREAGKGGKHSDLTKEKMKKPKADGFGEKIAERNRVIKLGNTYRLGIPHSEETKKLLSEKMKSLDPSKYHRGFTVPEERKKRISESVKNLNKITCQYCGKESSPSMHGRWHGNNCKHKK